MKKMSARPTRKAAKSNATKGVRRGAVKLQEAPIGDAWYYENPGSLHVFIEARDKSGKWMATVSTRIPRRKLEESLRRMRHASRRGKAS